MANPTISLCMIAKNEEKNIAECLNSVKDVADEIIIVDTGSTDKTKKIAEKFNANIVGFKWADDFSAARNESLKHATKDWILVLDADEVIDEESSRKIREAAEDEKTDAYALLIKEYTNNDKIAGFTPDRTESPKKNFKGFYFTGKCRLFRNHRDYSFEGAVHELVEPSIEKKKGKINQTNIIIHHYGNADPAVVKKKMQFYLELCKSKVKRKPDARSYYELGVLQKENENPEDAISSFRKAVELSPKNSLAGLALYEIGVIAEKQKEYDEAIKHYSESLNVRQSGETFQNLGVCYLKKGMLKEAYKNLVKAVMLNPNKYTIYNNLGAVLEKSGDYGNAVKMLEISIKLNPKNTIGYYNLGIVLDKRGDFGKAIQNYEKAVELGHPKSEEIKKRIKQIKAIIKATPKYGYRFKGFNVGG